MQHNLTTTPTEITGIAVGTTYVVQNQTSGIYVLLLVSDTEPEAGSNGYALGPLTPTAAGETFASIAAGEKLYAWVPFGTGTIWVGTAV